MAIEQNVLAAVPVPGLRPDSIGNYLVSLGLLRVLAYERWPAMRAGWNEGVFHLVGGPENIDDVLDVLSDVAAKRAWSPYTRGWSKAQKQSTKEKSGATLALWQASAEERELELFAAHAVPAARVSFNPLLGSGGNAGKRDFSEGWRRATEALAAGEGRRSHLPDNATKRAELNALLLGGPMSWMLEKLNAACWFSDTNKLFNSGQGPFREGAASPWAMALACEALAFFAGGPSRRLGSRARGVGAFPFVTRASAPRTAGEAGRDLGEVWAPLWDRPMTVREIVALFARGRAEVSGRGVLTPCAFATAVMRRGVDAGIAEFRRFVLGRTTSANTFEPRYQGTFRVRMPTQSLTPELLPPATAASAALQRVLALVDQLPADRKVGKRWRYVGLRGEVEAAMLRLAEAPSNHEAARALLDAVVSALDRIDRNSSFRERRVTWEPLPLKWMPTLFSHEAPDTEARLALALVSSFPKGRPFAVYRFGTEMEHGWRFAHPKQPPQRWVWRQGVPLPRVLSDVLHRRTLDWERARDNVEPVRLLVPAASVHVSAWHAGLDGELLGRWLSRLALFDWRDVPNSVKSLGTPRTQSSGAGPALCLFGLLQPLFDLRPVPRVRERSANVLRPETGARTPAAARALLGFLRARDVAAAIRFATARYAMAGAPIVRTGVVWDADDTERLTASLLFPIFDHERAALAERWLRPRREQGELVYA